MKLHLPDVTLVMIDTQCHELARLAMEDSLRDVEFGDAIIFSDEPINVAGTRWIKVPKWPNIAECSHFMWYELPDHIRTKWAINIQWDSWIVDVNCWTDEFLQYDYVGAPWWYDDDKLNVGNGCALRSQSLMHFLQANKERFPLSLSQEDHLIGRVYRPALEQAGFKWAPETLASQFSIECTRPSDDSRHFMFHDSFNFPFALKGERLAERVRLMRANPAIARKVAELDNGRRPIILPRLAACQKPNVTTHLDRQSGQSPDGGKRTAVPTFREFQKARVEQLLTTRRCVYPGDNADVHNFLPGLAELIVHAKPRTVIEIGSDRGVSTELFLLTTARVVAVDPWGNASSFQEFVERCAGYPHLELCRGKSPEALTRFGAEFDMCYIDADHSYEAVRRDILACTKIVKPDGWLAGHDYHQPQVERAVLSMIDDPMIFRDGSWLARNRLSQRLSNDQRATLAPAV
jgi:predicted O-methyltransferase YrrM